MKPRQTKLVRAAVTGAVCGFLLMLAIILFRPGGVQPPGQENSFNAPLRTINAPILWLAQGSTGNTPVTILGVCVYWALLGAVAGVLLTCFRTAVSRQTQPMEEPEKPAEATAGKPLRVAGIGAGSALVLALVVFLFKIAEPSQSGHRSAIGNLFRWLSMPVGWAMEWAVQRGFVERENIPVFLAAFFLYWISLGLLVAMAGYYFQRTVRGRHGRITGAT